MIFDGVKCVGTHREKRRCALLAFLGFGHPLAVAGKAFGRKRRLAQVCVLAIDASMEMLLLD
ncbi:MAG: hypothetical protein V3R27_08440, partial [Pseudomonadales bacterium]